MGVLTLFKSQKKRLLLTLLPIVLIDIIIFGVCLHGHIGDTNLLAFFEVGEFPRMYELPDMPHNFVILPILFLAAAIVWVCFADKDKLFAKIVAAKAVLFAILCYLPWYLFIMWKSLEDAQLVPYIRFLEFMMEWYLVIADVVLLAAILIKAARNRGKV